MHAAASGPVRRRRHRRPRHLTARPLDGPALFYEVTLQHIMQQFAVMLEPGTSLSAAHIHEIRALLARVRRLQRQLRRYPVLTHFPCGQGPDGILDRS